MSANQNEKERQIEGLIKFINSNGDSREMKRALAVKLALQGYVYRAIENILNVSQGYVSKWKKKFITQGIPGLRLGYKGAKTKLTCLRGRINHTVVIMPRILGYIRTRNIFNRGVRCHI
ncbi:MULTISPECIES: helix-turn-helix domain-containing protein [unclassified Microcoleus]|uniref:helix-turn-helix domain-containing protein n=2 Tax=unclassified Microcoleus TaxID=2642155 RepID=UPI002FD1087C